MKVKVAVMTSALPVAWTTRIRTASTTNSMPGLKNSRKPERRQQTPPVSMPTMRAKRTPTALSCFPMKGVTRNEVRQLVPMMKPYTDAPKPASSEIRGKNGGKRQTAKDEESVATSSTDRISHCRAVIRAAGGAPPWPEELESSLVLSSIALIKSV